MINPSMVTAINQPVLRPTNPPILAPAAARANSRKLPINTKRVAERIRLLMRWSAT